MTPFPTATPRTGVVPDPDLPGPPLHGFRGDLPAGKLTRPRDMTVAVSREAGARGTTVARKLAELLGWQVFDQETLDYLLQDDTARGQLLADVPAAAREWADEHLDRLQRQRKLAADADAAAMVRLVLTVAARGTVVIVGRGAGYVLPPATTLHARVVAPFESRVSYFAEAFRLTREEATAEVRTRDEKRAAFVSRTLYRDPAELYPYDVVVNSARLGVEGAAQFLGWALRTKELMTELAE